MSERWDQPGVCIYQRSITKQCFLYLDYEKHGVKIVDRESAFSSDIVFKLKPPTLEESKLLKENAILFSVMYPEDNKDLLKSLAERKVTAFAMDCIPHSATTKQFHISSFIEAAAGYK